MNCGKSGGRRLALSSILLGAALSACSPESEKPNKAEVLHLYTSSSEAAAVKAMSDAFARAGGTWVDTAIAGGPALRAATISRIVAGDPPAAVLSHGGAEISDLANNNVLRPIDSLAAKERWRAVMPAVALSAATYGGHVYAFPLLVEGMNWLWFNKSVLKQLGASDPRDWDEALKILVRAKQAGVVPLAFSGTKTYERGLFNAVLAGRGGAAVWRGIYSERNPDFAFSPAFKTAAEEFKHLHEFVDPGAPGRTWNDATGMVIRGQAAMQVMGDWAKNEFIAAGQTPGKEFGCVPLQSSAGGFVFRTEVFALPKLDSSGASSAQLLLAAALTRPEAQLAIGLKKGSLPARLDVDTSQFDICAQAAERVLKSGKALPSQEQLIVPSLAGELDDVISAYWNTPSMSEASFASKFANVLKQAS
jgi:glucose/mannose transport system substrate-binding protein